MQNLAVDWVNLKLYVLEAMVERIDACDFDGGNRVTLVAENLQTPHGLALDPTVGCVYTLWFSKAAELALHAVHHISYNLMKCF